jgi:hypothetical protein
VIYSIHFWTRRLSLKVSDIESFYFTYPEIQTLVIALRDSRHYAEDFIREVPLGGAIEMNTHLSKVVLLLSKLRKVEEF